MNTKNFFFTLFILAFLIPQQANSQDNTQSVEYRGKDYLDVDYGYGIHIWTGGLPMWMQDGLDTKGKANYIPYKVHEKEDHITYESASISFTIEKQTCDIKIFNSGKVDANETAIINSFSNTLKEAPNGTDNWTYSDINSAGCNTSIIRNFDGISVQVKKSTPQADFTTIYDTSVNHQKLEITYELENHAKENTKFGFTAVCSGKSCDEIKLNGEKLVTNSEINKTKLLNAPMIIGEKETIMFDTDNKIHDAFWTMKVQEDKTIFDFTDAKKSIPVGEKLRIDPTFSTNNPTQDGYIDTGGSLGASCSASIGSKTTTDTILYIKIPDANLNEQCQRPYFEWDLSSIPNGVDVVDTQFVYDMSAVSTPRNCDYVDISDRPSTASATEVWNGITTGTVYLDNDATCTTTGDNKSVDLSTLADAKIESQLISADWFSLGMKFQTEGRDAGTSHSISMVSEEGASPTPSPTLRVVYNTGSNPPSLTASPIINTIHLQWSPSSNGTTTSYKITRGITTGDTCTTGTMTTIVSDTGNNNTSYSDEDVTPGSCYSYQIYGYNGTALGSASNFANATIFDITSENTNMVDISFQRIDISNSQLRLNVTFSTPANLTCNFNYALANRNQTYYNIPSIIVDATHNESSFLINNAQREVITTICDDIDSNATATYVITQTDFPLKQQIENLRAGNYGTLAKIGALDLVTLVIIILSMVGLNRINESVGGIFIVAIVGVMAYFEFITWYTLLTSMIAVGLLWAVGITRKD